MTVKIVNSPGKAGYVQLIFDRHIGTDPLRVAFCNKIARTYLGYSNGRSYWSSTRSHFFEAILVSRGNGNTVFMIGPEVSNFIPNETIIEITTEDNAIGEVAVWRDVLL
jgi:hypothetical protein